MNYHYHATAAARTVPHLPFSKHVQGGCSNDVEMIAANRRQNGSGGARSSFSSSSSSATATTATDSSSTAMKDEYGRMDAAGESFVVHDFVLENGQVLSRAELRYRTYGQLNETTRDNVVVVCHALTGNASLDGWWGGLLGDGRAFDTSKYFIVCCNILGSCYGSTSPVSICPETQQPYGMDFPDISVQDTVRLQLQLLREALQIRQVRSVIGGSFGGMQAVEFAVQAGSSSSSDREESLTTTPFVQSFIPIACNAQHGAWQIAISEVQRQAIYRDPAWQAGHYHQATQGLQVARQLGMISYRTFAGYAHKFDRRMMSDSSNPDTSSSSSAAYGKDAHWQVASYLVYQGEKFISRFDPITYVKLTQQMDSHDVARNRGKDVADVLSRVNIPALVLGIDSDLLYPIQQQQELARLLPRATFRTIHSDEGHDGFLLEQEQVGRYITDFLQQVDEETAAAATVTVADKSQPQQQEQ